MSADAFDSRYIDVENTGQDIVIGAGPYSITLSKIRRDTDYRGFDVTHYGAKGDGVTNDAEAIQDALDALTANGGGILIFPYGTFQYDSADSLYLPSNTTVYIYGQINMVRSDTILFRAFQKTRVQILGFGGAIYGNGVNGGAWMIYLAESTQCTVEGLTLRNGSTTGIELDLCQDCIIRKNDIRQMWNYGGEDKRGKNNIWTLNQLSQNGTGTSTRGRGLTVWMGSGIEVSHNTVYGNNEYGIRVYTQGDDTLPTENIRIIGNNCKDNQVIDIHVYGTPKDVLVANNTIRQTTDKGATGINVSGTRVAVLGNELIHDTVSVAVAAGFVLSTAVQCSVKNNLVNNYSVGMNITNNTSSQNVISRNEFLNCLSGITLNGASNIIANNRLVHSATAAVFGDNGINQADASTGNVVDGNYMEAFHSGILLNQNVDIVVKNNVCRSSVHSNFRTFLTDLHNVTMLNNDFQNFASSELWRRLEINGQRKGYRFNATSDPSVSMSTFAFQVGDTAYSNTPAAGGKLGWVCTTAGTPGTWKPFGAIDA